MLLYPTDILLPDFKRTDGTLWATVACDQYTSEPEYWDEVSRITKGKPTTLRMMLPEIYLDRSNTRVPEIHGAMRGYLDTGVLTVHPGCGVWLERTLASGKVRGGLVCCIDLEDYDYSASSVSPVRATEKTVLERIPPRLAVRRGAPLEMPHVMLLLDDRGDTVLGRFRGRDADAYAFPLMQNSGSVRGSYVGGGEFDAVNAALAALTASRGCENPIVLAVGDGNHSLATAKAAYEELKKTLTPEEAARHPARMALCEIVNLHDSSLEFEPIYRLVTLPETQALVRDFRQYAEKANGSEAPQSFRVITDAGEETVTVPHPEKKLAVATLQTFLDSRPEAGKSEITDYIHGDGTLARLAAKTGNVGFLFEGMSKAELFAAVEADGVLPRKTFSMGHAADKRFYVECRRITEE